jgi:HlyD family secretion protein
MKHAGKGLILILVAVATAVAWWWFRPEPLRVTVVEVAFGEVQSTVSNTRAGTVDACRRAGMSPSLGGQISSLPLNEGDSVKTDQVMLELRNADQRAELELARRDFLASHGHRDEV